MKLNYLSILLVFLCIKLQAQNASTNQYKNWVFGNNTGISFLATTPTTLPVNTDFALDYSASISDDTGNLLFYTNGENVWGAPNNLIQNGTGLFGSTSGGQNALIIKKPLAKVEDNSYYIFTVTNYATGGLNYSIVDMSANNNLGSVTQKNISLNSISTEKLTAIYNSKYNFYWIITHNWNSNEFACYKLNSTGISITPIISSVGLTLNQGNFGSSHDAMGEISVSPNGTKIACAYTYSGMYELYDFAIETGIISNAISISNYNWAWGVEFSADSKKIYTTQWTSDVVNQFDLTNYNQTDISNSVSLVGNVSTANGLYTAGYLELAPDGKIYIAKYDEPSLATISATNANANNCGFNNNGFVLQNGTSKAGLTNTPVFPPNSTNIQEEFAKFDFSIFPNPSNKKFTIKTNEITKLLNIKIFDILGCEVYSETYNEIKSANINLPNNTKGIYTIRVTNGKQIANKNIIIQ